MIQSLLWLMVVSFSQVSHSENVATQTVQVFGDVSVGHPLPSFNGQEIRGTRVSSRNVLGKGHTVVISYCATWCLPCREGLSIIEAEVQADSTVDALYIALDKEPIKVQRWARDLGLNSPIIVDRFQTVAKRHGVVVEGRETVLPITFIVSQTGVVETIFTVEGEDFKTRLHSAIQSAVPADVNDDANGELKQDERKLELNK